MKFLLRLNSPIWAQTASFFRFLDHGQTHRTRYNYSGWVIGPTQRPLHNSTRQTKETDIHDYGWIYNTIILRVIVFIRRHANWISSRAITSDGLWYVWVCLTFPSFLLKSTIFGKMLRIKSVFCLCLQILSEVFLLPKKIQEYIIINILRFSCLVPDIYIRFKQTWITTSHD